MADTRRTDFIIARPLKVEILALKKLANYGITTIRQDRICKYSGPVPIFHFPARGSKP
jgi:hypothetical protein